ncbi:hypothetical protein DLREEDagrD3_14930 [Denitratisoma sp. agr-D3]
MSLRFRPLLLALLIPAAAQAGVLYKCTSENGGTTYTNTRDGYRNCTVVSRDGPAAVSAPARAKSSTSSPADFPKVSGDTQKSRDNDRRRILDQEVASEQKGLEEARKALAEQEAARVAPERLQALRDRIALHNRNLDALRRELEKFH